MKKILSLLFSMTIFINLCLFNPTCFSDTKVDSKWHLDTAITGFTQYQVAYVKNKYHVSVGQKGTIRISKDGLDWTTVPSGTTNNLYGIAYNSNMFVAVGQNGTILTSQNGDTWKKVYVSCKSTFYKVQCIKGIFFAPSSSGDVWTSKDGTTWSKIKFNISGQSFLVDAIWTGKEYAILLNSSISFTNDNDLTSINVPLPYICGNSSYICSSTNGTKWNVHEFQNTLTSICSNGKSIVLSGQDVIFTLNNKNIWVKTDVTKFSKSDRPIELNAIVWNGKKFTILGAHGDNNLLSMNSTDGINWSYYEKDTVLGDGIINTRKLYWTGKLYISMYYIFRMPNYTFMGMLYSTDGVHWKDPIFNTYSPITKLTSPTTWDTFPHNLCFDGNNYVVIGINGWSAVSKDGINWTDSNLGSFHFSIFDNINKVFWSEKDKSFYAVSDMYKEVYSSEDGIRWSYRGRVLPADASVAGFPLPIQTDTANQVRLKFPTKIDGINVTNSSDKSHTFTAIYSNGNYVSTYLGNTIISSVDGINWVKRYKCKKGSYILKLKLLGNKYVGVGSNGLIVTSDNGSTWKDESYPTDEYFVDVACGDNKFIAITQNANIVYKLSNK